MEYILRPLAAFILFAAAAALAFGIRRVIPSGRIKQALYRSHPIVPHTAEERRNHTPLAYLFMAVVAQFAIIDMIIWLNDGQPILLKFLP